jgi:lysophospholipid acyltransferase (LPLAT)-like uncharacterized protein
MAPLRDLRLLRSAGVPMSILSDSPLTRAQRIHARAIAAAAYPLIAGLCRTLTWKVEGDHYYHEVLRWGRRPIMAFWHGRIIAATHHFRHRGIVVITSQNFDGEWIAGIIERFGYGTARGSTSRGGARALVRLRRELSEGRSVGFTLDGPRGPAKVAQPGAVWLAGASGCPLLPFHIEASRFWSASSWDSTQIPKPFSTVAVAIGPPIEIADTSEDIIERGRCALEAALAALEVRALDLVRQR